MFNLYAASGHVKHVVRWNRFSAAPAVRLEHITLLSNNLLATASDPNNTGDANYNRLNNSIFQVLPGIAFDYNLKEKGQEHWTLFTGIYKGYTPPTSEVGFLFVDEEGNVSNPTDISLININPETSMDIEAGTRFNLKNNAVEGQFAYFFNDVKNYYAAGRREAFQTLGNVHIHGVEAGATLNLHNLAAMKGHTVSLSGNVTVMRGKVISGAMVDSDILAAKHTDATKNELVTLINENPGGIHVYFKDQNGKDSLVTSALAVSDFSKISKLEMEFGGDDGLNVAPPNLPDYLFTVALNYGYKGFGLNVIYNRVGNHYAEYLNLVNETGEGAIGRIDAYHTLDATLSYSFRHSKNDKLDGLRLFVSGKNIFNDPYKASRLHRVSSGIFPAGFAQLLAGVEWKF